MRRRTTPRLVARTKEDSHVRNQYQAPHQESVDELASRSSRLDIRSTAWLSIAVAVFLVAAGALSADENAANIGDTRAALEKYVETRRLISRERRDFALAKETLNERIALVQREMGSIHEKSHDAQNSIVEADKKRSDLDAENETLKKTLSSLDAAVASLEDRTRQLLQRLPDPIRERVKPLSQRLPEKPVETRLSLSERFQNIVGILNEVDKFNRDITVASEMRKLPDGSAAEVIALYIGIGQGYYTGTNGTIGAIGTALADKWVWKPVNEAAPQIAEAIAIAQNERVASFVQLPIDIQ
jgi:FtsZ-binding cell division protein ZapB